MSAGLEERVSCGSLKGLGQVFGGITGDAE